MSKSNADEFLAYTGGLAEFEEKVLPQEIADSYNTVALIGQNDFGETYILSEKNTKNLYVLKKQQTSSAGTGNEADLLKELCHKGIPTYEKVIEHGDTRYILRKYIEGTPLDEFMREMSSVDPMQVIDDIISLCDVLIYLHSQPEPIIHRDIKPSNIIIDNNNSVVLIDFGISRKYQANAEKDTTYFGTHEYAPPEQYGYAQTDCRSDIYSLGVVIRYWLTGKTDNNAKIKDKKLERIVSKCTAFAPEARYQSAYSLKRALIAYKKRGKRRIITAVACLAAAVALAVGIGLYAGSSNLDIPDDTSKTHQTPVGYDNTEYQRLVAFFLYGDNLAKIKAQHSDFDIEIPATWYWERGETSIDDDGIEHPLVNFVAWAWGRVHYIHLTNLGLTGVFDVSDFDQLQTLDVPNNNLTEINLSGCTSLSWLQVDREILANLDLSELPALEYVN